MKDAQKPDHVSLNTLIGRLREGRFVIPDFQREFEWKPWDIRDLMRSIFLDYYIGSLLLWNGKKENFDGAVLRADLRLRGLSDNPNTSCWTDSSASPLCTTRSWRPTLPLPTRANRYLLLHPRRPVHGGGIRRRRSTTTGRGAGCS